MCSNPIQHCDSSVLEGLASTCTWLYFRFVGSITKMGRIMVGGHNDRPIRIWHSLGNQFVAPSIKKGARSV